MMAHLFGALVRLEEHWLGNAIGGVGLFLILFGCLFVGCGMGLK